jgi:hypothetical protein
LSIVGTDAAYVTRIAQRNLQVPERSRARPLSHTDGRVTRRHLNFPKNGSVTIKIDRPVRELSRCQAVRALTCPAVLLGRKTSRRRGPSMSWLSASSSATLQGTRSPMSIPVISATALSLSTSQFDTISDFAPT